ncbi:MAG: tRNA dihydrouridine synthase DusB [Filifactor alocis]|nr:tRNA dihydrouridine synthase DusB [Filifactor alocis]
MKIGNYVSKGNVFLAPMAGITDLPFRVICKKYGASLVYTEMINAKALCYGDETTWKMLQTHPDEGDVAVQIFGNEKEFIAKAIRILEELERFVLIDINMGCPAPKIVKNLEGSALMKDPALAGEIITAAKEAATLPVTVKFRKGWDAESVNALDFAKMAERAGADAVTVHGRTREEYYSGQADWEIIKKIKEILSIPVIGNGDIVSYQSYTERMDFSGVDAVMIGRGAQGNPFIFEEIQEKDKADRSYELIERTIREHYEMEISYKGEDKAVKEMRKHICWYIKSLPLAAKVRNQVNQMTDKTSVLQVLEEYFDYLRNNSRKQMF